MVELACLVGLFHMGRRAGPETGTGDAGQTASAPRSPVRIRMASSIVEMKILPSPMRPI